jgi:hypothetical protein
LKARKLLRHRPSGLWITPVGLAPDLNAATEIASFTEALRICMKNGYHDVEIVLKFPDDKDDVILPIEDSWDGPVPLPERD